MDAEAVKVLMDGMKEILPMVGGFIVICVFIYSIFRN